MTASPSAERPSLRSQRLNQITSEPHTRLDALVKAHAPFETQPNFARFVVAQYLFQSELVALYNDVSRQEMEHVRDFIILHYHATQRDEPLWKACREMQLPDSLEIRLRAWRERAHAWQDPDELFRVDSWTSVLMGQGIQPGPPHPLAAAINDADLRTLLARIRQPVQQAVLASKWPHLATRLKYRKA